MSQSRKKLKFRRPRERRVNRPRTVRDDGPPFITGLLPTGRKVLSFEPPEPVEEVPAERPAWLEFIDWQIEDPSRRMQPTKRLQPSPEISDELIEAVLNEFLAQRAEVGK